MNSETGNERPILIDKFFNEYPQKVFSEILPGMRVSHVSSTNQIPDWIDFPETNRSFEGSDYYFDPSQKRFVHFTSLEKLTNILVENSIRLYDLNFMDDPNEIDFPLKECHLKIGDPQFSLERLRMMIHSFSFCDFAMAEDEEYNMWRLYGQDGYGVEIQFSFLNTPTMWENFHLSEIYYKDKPKLLKIRKSVQNHFAFIDELKSFNYHGDNHGLWILNGILSLLAFHKQGIFRNEKEYRLIYHFKGKSNKEKGNLSRIRTMNKIKALSFYIKLPISKFNGIATSNKIPLIKIEKVVLGYRYSEKDRLKIQETLHQITAYNEIHRIAVEITSLKEKYFNK